MPCERLSSLRGGCGCAFESIYRCGCCFHCCCFSCCFCYFCYCILSLQLSRLPFKHDDFTLQHTDQMLVHLGTSPHRSREDGAAVDGRCQQIVPIDKKKHVWLSIFRSSSASRGICEKGTIKKLQYLLLTFLLFSVFHLKKNGLMDEALYLFRKASPCSISHDTPQTFTAILRGLKLCRYPLLLG